MNAFIARLRRGCAHVWAKVKEWAWERPRAALAGVPWVRWRAQMAEAAETKAGLRHMLEVASVDEPTDDQRIGLIRMEEGYQLQRRTLLRKQEEQGGELTTPQLYELHAIDKALAELRLKREGATPETVGHFRMRSFAAVGAARGFLGAVPGGIQMWLGGGLLAACAFMFVLWKGDTARLRHERDRQCSNREITLRDGEYQTSRQPCVQLGRANEAARGWRREYEAVHRDYIEARQQAAATAETLEAERRRSAAARERERRRTREVQQVLTGGDPPNWERSVRDAGASEPRTGAGASGAQDRDPG